MTRWKRGGNPTNWVRYLRLSTQMCCGSHVSQPSLGFTQTPRSEENHLSQELGSPKPSGRRWRLPRCASDSMELERRKVLFFFRIIFSVYPVGPLVRKIHENNKYMLWKKRKNSDCRGSAEPSKCGLIKQPMHSSTQLQGAIQHRFQSPPWQPHQFPDFGRWAAGWSSEGRGFMAKQAAAEPRGRAADCQLWLAWGNTSHSHTVALP